MEIEYVIMLIIGFLLIILLLCRVFHKWSLPKSTNLPTETLQQLELLKKEIFTKRLRLVSETDNATKIVSEIRTDDSYIIEMDLIGDTGQKVTMKIHARLLYQYIDFSLKYGSFGISKIFSDAKENLFPLELAEKIAEFTKQQLVPSTKDSKELVQLFIKQNA